MNAYHQYKICIDACLNCAAVCNHCAASCAKENKSDQLSNCIQLTMECAAICYAAAQLMSLGSDKIKELCALCAVMCDTCAAECNRHENIHCRECAAICTKCADECEIV